MQVLTPAPAMPWPVVSPFRMQPGLSRLPGPPPLLHRDALAPAYAEAKRAVLADPARAPVGRADAAVLQAVAEVHRRETGETLAPTVDALTLGLQEDFVVLADEADGFRARLLSVCFPSSWNPADKQGQDFTAIHAPVADNALLLGAARGIVDMAFRQSSMERHVWLVAPDGGLAQHPETRRRRWDDALSGAGAHGRLIDHAFFRVERQTTLPLPQLKAGVFFIRVMVAPLGAVLAVAPTRAAQLRTALASMSDAVVAYRGMAAVRGRLLAELDQASA
ncbi:MAG: DUF3445 domain-containing protein [Hydrogenophaga sp.]|nr:DUF3445 domain-containing protein [Hydrogenophaga sp.]